MWNPTHVQVTVVKAKNLLIKGKSGANNPFVTIAIGKEKYQTSVKENIGDEPVVWQEQCELSLSQSDNTTCIVFTALHRGLIDQFLGTVSIPLSSLDIHKPPKCRWYKLEAKPSKKEERGKEKKRGELEVRIAFTVKAATGSLMDLTKKDKHRTSVGQLSAKLGGSLLSLGSSERRTGLNKIVKNLGKKVTGKKRDANGGDGASEKGSLENITFSSHGDAGSTNVDPGVISEDEDEFTLDNLSYKSSETSLTNSPMLENLAGGELLRRSKKAPTKPPRTSSPVVTDIHPEGVDEWEQKLYGRSGDTLKRGQRASPLASAGPAIANNASPILTTRSKTIDETIPTLASSPIDHYTPSPQPAARRFMSSPNLQKQDSEDTKEPSKISKKLKQFQGFIKEKKEERFIIGEESGDTEKLAKPEYSRHAPEVLEMFRGQSRDDLISTVLELESAVQVSKKQMKETEDYLDNLLVRVMETSPRILQGPILCPGNSGFKSH